MIGARGNPGYDIEAGSAVTPVPAQYQIHINFLPVVGNFPAFTIYRRAIHSPQEERPGKGIWAYRLPDEAGESWQPYWVSIEPATGFFSWETLPSTNRDLTCRVLHWSLVSCANRLLKSSELAAPRGGFVKEVSFIQRRCNEGDELLVVQPYFLRATSQFGYLVDFHFHLREGVPFSKKVQQLSLNLDSNFRRNLDYYADRSSRVETFVKDRQGVFRKLGLPGSADWVSLASQPVALLAHRLRAKTYVFAGNREARSQFNGLREYGPLQSLDRAPRLLFLFREQDRPAARRLAASLRVTQQRERFSFPGFSALFKCDLEIDGNPVVLPDLTHGTIEKALDRVRLDRQEHPNVVPVVILPSGDDDSYLTQKALFLQAGVPTQVWHSPHSSGRGHAQVGYFQSRSPALLQRLAAILGKCARQSISR